MTAQDLKNSILQLAIQGKLVEQREGEGTARQLLEIIKEEKTQLIKEGKIKKQKFLPEIKEEEIPFDIPESWQWVRLGQLCNYGVCNSISAKNLPNGAWLLDLEDIEKDSGRLLIKKKVGDVRTSSSKHVFATADVLYSKLRPYLNKVIIADENGYCTSEILPLNFGVNIYNQFAQKVLMSSYFINYTVKCSYGVKMPRLGTTDGRLALFPLPPLEEQKRIVAKIEELLPYIDQYNAVYSEVEAVNKRFPKDMQKSILQYAIQGKLVEQRAEEGTAEALYKQIQEEKKKLIKEGMIKRQKVLAEIKEDEIPFEIPESWKWVRLGDIFEINPRNNLDDEINASFVPMTLIEDGYRNEFSYEIRQWGEIKKGYTHFQNGDIVMAKITPCFQNLKSAIMDGLENNYGAGTTELHVLRPYIRVDIMYFLWFIKNPDFISSSVKNMTGTAGQKRVPTDIVRNCVVPLPPLAEQKRIVGKIEELLPYTKQLMRQ